MHGVCEPGQSRGGCVPVVVFEDVGSCAGPAGTPTLGVASYALDVTNPPDLTWRDEDYVPIEAYDNNSVFTFDNL